MNWKEIYTKLFLKELGHPVSEISLKQYMPLWWQNTRNKNNGGLRLTDDGLEALTSIGLAVYEIPFPKEMPLTAQVIIFLDQFIDCPYYLSKESITVTNERKAVELTMFSGDLRKYGFAKAMSKSRKENLDT